MAKSVKGTQTEKNLLTSFAGESQARMRYTYFASTAKKEGYEQIAAIFEETAAIYGNAKKTANWFMGEVLRLTKDKAMDAEQVSFSPKHLADLLVMVEKSEVSPQNAKKVFEKVFEEDIDPVVYIEEHGLKIVEDTGLLEETINRILDANPGPLSELLGGKDKVMGFFVGQIMKEMKGKANPDSVRKALAEEIERRR